MKDASKTMERGIYCDTNYSLYKNKQSKPCVSFIVPVYNAEKYLEEALHSLFNQVFENFEVVIVNDGSTDKSDSLIKQYLKKYENKAQYIYLKKNRGIAFARNIAMHHADGEYFIFADSDDIQDKTRAKNIYKTFMSTKADIVLNNCEMINEASFPLGRDLGFPIDINNKNVFMHSLQRNYFWTSTTAVKKSSIIFFDESIKNSSDYELFLRLFYNNHKFTFIETPLTKYRLHQSNISANRIGANESVSKILSKYSDKDLCNKLRNDGIEEFDVLITMGIIHTIKKNFAIARKWLDNSLSIANNEEQKTVAFFHLGVATYELGYVKNAYKNFYNSYVLKKGDPAVLNNYGAAVLMYKNDIAFSKKLFESALFIEPNYLDAKYNLDNVGHEDFLPRISPNFLRKSLVHS